MNGMCHSCPFPLSDRDSLKLRSRVVGDNGRYWFSVHKSVAHHPKIPEDPKIVRTESEGCFLVHKTDDSDKSCVLVSILQNDPKGAIPSSIVNFAVSLSKTTLVKCQSLT